MFVKSGAKYKYANFEKYIELSDTLKLPQISQFMTPEQLITWLFELQKLNPREKLQTEYSTKLHECIIELESILPSLSDFHVLISHVDLLEKYAAYDLISEFKLVKSARKLINAMITPVKLKGDHIIQQTIGKYGWVPASNYEILEPEKNATIIKLPCSEHTKIYNTEVIRLKSQPNVGVSYIEMRKSNLLIDLPCTHNNEMSFKLNSMEHVYETYDRKSYRRLKPSYINENWHSFCTSYNAGFEKLVMKHQTLKKTQDVQKISITTAQTISTAKEKSNILKKINGVTTYLDKSTNCIQKREIKLLNHKIDKWDLDKLKYAKLNVYTIKFILETSMSLL
jgi:hypothetical protein